MIPLLGYAPDIDPTTPGVFTDCNGIIPSLKGFEAAPAPISTGVNALSSACAGAAVLTKLDNSIRVFAGAQTALYELSGSTWNNNSRSSGPAYNLGASIRWSFAQFGNVSLAVAKTDQLQGTTSGKFENVSSTAPAATVVETVGQFVFLMDVNDVSSIAGYGDSPDRWWCCAKGDHTSWTPSIALECASGRLTSSPGPIVGAKRFGDSIIAYKLRSMFRGTYVGPPQTWMFDEIPGEAGALGQQAIVNVGLPDSPVHIFMGWDDFYRFDGGRPVRIGSPVRETVFSQINRTYAHQSSALHDRAKSRIYFYYPTGISNVLEKCVVYNYKTDKWGRDDRTIEAVMDYQGTGITYDALGSSYSTYQDLPNVTYDSTFFAPSNPIPAIFDTSHALKTLNGSPASSWLTSGDYGDDRQFSTLSRVRPRFLTKPSSAYMTNYYRNELGGSLTQDQTTFMSGSRFDVLREARWHRMNFIFTGALEFTAFDADFIPGGEE